MRLPRGGEAVIDERKVIDYLLSTTHAVGRHKARVFFSALGLAVEDAPIIVAALRSAAVTGDATLVGQDDYGMRYRIDFRMTHSGKSGIVRSAWRVPPGESHAIFLTAFMI